MNQIINSVSVITFFVSRFLLSWVLIHLLAALGLFLALAYPVWWFFLPRQTACFFCRAGQEGTKCLACRSLISRNELFPKTLISTLANGLLLAVLSILSIGLVFTEMKVLRFFGFPPAGRTVSFVIPTRQQYRLGELIPLRIEVSGVETPINTVQADLSFPAQKMEIVNFSTNGSFADIFVQKEMDNETGYARLTGGLPNPGFGEDRGHFATAFFRGKEPGVAKIAYLPSSLVLANDGKGTNVLKAFPEISYLILPDKISPEEENQQRELFKNSSTVLGAATDRPQLVFFDDSKVLGVREAARASGKTPKPGPAAIVLGSLGKIDNLILDFWKGLTSKKER